MRVPLDYYQILMLSIHADSEGVERAYHSRQLQELWPGYSAETITSRQRLMEQAHHVLSDPYARHEYDSQLTVADPVLEVAPQDLAAALAIQCENGEYQEALAGAQLALRQTHPAPDLLLTQAIARLHLGREEWANGDYEAAASMLQQALAELVNHRVFPEVQAEVISDLSKLRPYRILKLLSHPNISAPERQEGFSLLRSMLDDRAGIEGTGQDGSELSTEDFLRFVQKARSQMTISEQQDFFEAEAKRPSVVATYLAVYALIARGYVENRPALIRRARGYLVRLTQRHDVNLEQSICALFLGQPEEATRLLECSQDSETIASIRKEASITGGGETDLLLGLCRYIETWLQQEVFPEYRDLDTSNASLRNYFDNPQVQQYLDEMPASSSDTEWFARQIEHVALPNALAVPTSDRVATSPHPAIGQKLTSAGSLGETSELSSIPLRSRVPQCSPATNNSDVPAPPPLPYRAYPPSNPSLDNGNGASNLPGSNPYPPENRSLSSSSAASMAPDRNLAPSSGYEYGDFPNPDRRHYGDDRLSIWLWRLGALVVVILLLVFGIRALSGLFRRAPEEPEAQEQVEPETLPADIPEAVVLPEPAIDISVLTPELAKTTIESWQTSKQSALGATRDIESLNGILVEPMLSQWRGRAEALRQANAHYEYTLRGVEVEDVTQEDGAEKGSVIVSISEGAKYFVNGALQGAPASYDSTYRVRYNLVLTGDSWAVESYTAL